MFHTENRLRALTVGVVVLTLAMVSMGCAQATDLTEAVSLFDSEDLSEAWREPIGDWTMVGDTFTDPNDEKALGRAPGGGTAMNGEGGHTTNLISKIEHGDVKVHVEFMVPKGSNSGVYFQGRYEIQVLDSWGVEKPTYTDCGGIYQRWREEPGIEDSERGYEGHAPRVNAAKKPGEWQSFDAIFKAPRFDADGKKVADAEFVRVEHNGTVIHEGVKLSGPTRSAIAQDERPTGPLMLQGDHGPVSYRNLRIEPLIE